MNLTRYKQDRNHCSVGACASVANYYDKLITYDVVKEEAYRTTNTNKKTYNGTESGEIGTILNNIGFESVEIVTCNYDIINYKWANLDPTTIGNRIKAKCRRENDNNPRSALNTMSRFLLDGFDNKITITNNFRKIIKNALKKSMPIIIAFNWSMFAMIDMPERAYHVVALEKCSKKHVNVVDSHWRHYKGELAKYASGKYKMLWEDLMLFMDEGTIFIPSNFQGMR